MVLDSEVALKKLKSHQQQPIPERSLLRERFEPKVSEFIFLSESR